MERTTWIPTQTSPGQKSAVLFCDSMTKCFQFSLVGSLLLQDGEEDREGYFTMSLGFLFPNG